MMPPDYTTAAAMLTATDHKLKHLLADYYSKGRLPHESVIALVVNALEQIGNYEDFLSLALDENSRVRSIASMMLNVVYDLARRYGETRSRDGRLLFLRSCLCLAYLTPAQGDALNLTIAEDIASLEAESKTNVGSG